MGDVAMTTPVLRELTESYPDARVVMLTREFFRPFFFGIERFELHDLRLKGEHAGLKGLWRLYRELCAAYKIDVVVDLHDKIYSKLLLLFFRVGGYKCVSIDKGRAGKKALTRAKDKVMIQQKTSIERYADCFAAVGFPLKISNHFKKFQRPLPDFIEPCDKLIGIAPFASFAGKIMPTGLLEGVLSEIAKKYPDYKIIIFGGGESERVEAERLEKEHTNALSAIGRLSLESEMDLMANLSVMIAMDSSAMHLCSLVGTRVVSLWGATHPLAGFLGWGQSSSDVVQLEMDCRPCSVYGNKPCLRAQDEQYKCLGDIKPEMLVERLKL